MLIAGGFVYWLHHEQDRHATPPAIATAVVIASIAAGFLGWLMGRSYLKAECPIVVAVLVPVVVLFGTTLAASVCYHFADAIFNLHARELVFHPLHGIGSVARAAFAYVFYSAPVWVFTLPFASLIVRKTAIENGI